MSKTKDILISVRINGKWLHSMKEDKAKEIIDSFINPKTDELVNVSVSGIPMIEKCLLEIEDSLLHKLGKMLDKTILDSHGGDDEVHN